MSGILALESSHGESLEQQDAGHPEPLEVQSDQPQPVNANTSKLEELANEGEALSALGSFEWVGRVAQAALQDLGASSENSRKTSDTVLNKVIESGIPLQVSEGTFKVYLGKVAKTLESPITSTGRQRGAGFYISQASSTTATAFAEQASPQQAVPAVAKARVEKEKLLYPVLTQWLMQKNYRAKDISSGRMLGKWGNPDVAGIQIHDHFGSIELEVATIEAKVSVANWRQDIFEAISHRRYANRAYYAFAVPEDSAEKESDEIRYYSEKFGVGVLAIEIPNELYASLFNGTHQDEVSADDAEVREIYSPKNSLVPLRYRREFCEAVGITKIEDLGSWGKGL
jgi:hypothetical protein